MDKSVKISQFKHLCSIVNKILAHAIWKSFSLHFIRFAWNYFTFCLETKMPWCQTPSRKKKTVVFTNVTANVYQSQLNAGFSKVCEIFKVCGIESLKYIREFHTPVCYCGEISTPRNVMLYETNCVWLFDMSVKRPHGRALANEWALAIYSRTSAISLKVWLRETS